tara:strand:+ start:852 stop:1394 length:543 start_codon:yes stop_codon:yes gene_type:complete
MIYLPGRAVFIHIPRTGGNSIKNAIASSCFSIGFPAVVSTISPVYQEFDRIQIHARAIQLKGYIREWNDIYRFAVHRPMEERMDSTIKFMEKLRALGVCGDDWPVSLPEELKDTFCRDDYKEHAFKEYSLHTTQFFTEGDYGEDLGVEVYNFEDLADRWHEICDKCQIPRCELPHINKSN